MRFSIIINNYNYGRFVGQAIESVLAVDWPDKEIIVVDDGSTDDSRTVIESFGERITSIFAENRGQAAAANAGFERSMGDVVIFLDADDVLLRSIAQQVMSVWHPGIAKVQYGMIYVDQALRPLGRCWPVYTAKDTPKSVSRLMRQTGDYLSSPTSGNAWSRDFLNEVFPLPTRAEGLHWIDMYLQKVAPFFGDVVSLTIPQCLYRRHGNNDSSFAFVDEYLEKYNGWLNQVETVHRLGDKLLQRKNRAISLSYKNEFYTKVALVSKRFFPRGHSTTMLTVLARYWQTVWHGEFSTKQKTLFFVWSLAVAAAPRRVASWIVLSRDNHQSTGQTNGAVAATLRRLFARAHRTSS
jgi:glycosyltransferase involved in cell wall biosynthesis